MTREEAKQQAREELAESLGVPIGDLAWLNRLWGRGFDAGWQRAYRETARTANGFSGDAERESPS